MKRMIQLVCSATASLLICGCANGGEIAAISGKVTSDGVPVPNALVVVAFDDVDLRDHRTLDDVAVVAKTRSNAKGLYRLEVDLGKQKQRNVFLDVRAPHFETAAGTYTGGTQGILVSPETGDSKTVDVKLKRALYVTGRIRDSNGQGVSGVDIKATIHFPSSMAYLCETRSDSNGDFCLYDIPFAGDFVGQVKLAFRSDEYVAADYEIDRESAKNGEMRIDHVADRGVTLSGSVVGPDGKPIPRCGVFVRVTETEGIARDQSRAGFTDGEGRFVIKGLLKGHCKVEVIKPDESILSNHVLELPDSKNDVVLTTKILEPAPPQKEDAIEVFGLKLATVTPYLVRKYGLEVTEGVVVVDAKKQMKNTGWVCCEGDCIQIIGSDKIPNNKALVKSLYDYVKDQRGWITSVVVLERRTTGDGLWYTNTIHIDVNESEAARIQKLFREL
jgi:hypothetical protein